MENNIHHFYSNVVIKDGKPEYYADCIIHSIDATEYCSLVAFLNVSSNYNSYSASEEVSYFPKEGIRVTKSVLQVFIDN